VIAYLLYRPQVQQSKRCQATVVPLANIMDVGFIIMSPAIVLLAGFSAPLVMLGVCLVAIAAGFAIAYNIRHYEPLVGTDDPLNRVERTAQWALLGASVINIAYYTLLLMALFLPPFDAFTKGRQSFMGMIYLAIIALIGYFGGMALAQPQGRPDDGVQPRRSHRGARRVRRLQLAGVARRPLGTQRLDRARSRVVP
jgi:hypothetical protein